MADTRLQAVATADVDGLASVHRYLRVVTDAHSLCRASRHGIFEHNAVIWLSQPSHDRLCAARECVLRLMRIPIPSRIQPPS